jgi:hypothetical protein
VVINSSPENYEYWLSKVIEKTGDEFPHEERFVFVNAWNEWAEGCHLEPDRKYQCRFLEATLRARNGQTIVEGFWPDAEASVSRGPERTLLGDLRAVFAYHAALLFGRLVSRLKTFPRVRRVLRKVISAVR